MNCILLPKAQELQDMNYGRQTEPISRSSKMSIPSLLVQTVVSVLEHRTTLARPNSKSLAITCYLSPMMVQQVENYGLQMELQQVHIY